MTVQNLSELEIEVAAALEAIEKIFDDSADEYVDCVDPRTPEYRDEHDPIQATDRIEITLPRSDGCVLEIEYSDLSSLVEELKEARLVDKTECWGRQRVFVRIESIGSYINHLRLEQLARHDEPIHVEQVNGCTYMIYVRSDITLFGMAIAATGDWCKEFPPAYGGETFIEVTWDDSHGGEHAMELVYGLIFELSSTLQLPVQIAHHPTSEEAEDIDYDTMEDDPEDIRLRPLLHGEGIEEVLKLYSAATASSLDYSIVGYTKVLEHVSETVVRESSASAIRTKLQSHRALTADADFIRELEVLITNHSRQYRKDSVR